MVLGIEKTDREKAGLVSESALVSFIDEEFTRRQRERLPYELQWQLNINFIEGNQYCDIDPYRLTIEEVEKMYAWQERESFNQIAPVLETRVSRLTTMKPILKARAPTTSADDIRSSRVSTQLLRNIYYDQGVGTKLAEVYAWAESTGTCFVKNIWNPDKGPIIGEIEVIEIDERGEEQVTTEFIREGGLDVIVIPPYEIFPDSNYRNDIHDCRSFIHAKAIHVDEIEEHWGVEVLPEQTSTLKLQKTLTGQSWGVGAGHYFTTQDLKNHAVVKEYWEKPTKTFPQGRLITVANGKLLHEGNLFYPIGTDGELAFPVERVVSIKRPGIIWGRCVVDRLIPVQRRYNALRNRKAEFLNRCAIGQWVTEEGSVDLDDVQENAGQPGYIYVYQRGFNAPQPVRNDQLPIAFDTEEMALLQEINVFSGTSDLAKQSKAPPGVKSGVAMSIALEQDDTRLSSTAKHIEHFLVRCGKVWLRMHQIFVSGSRILKAIGEDNILEYLDWSASDITSDDVYVEPFSALAESPAQRRQMVFDLLASGLFHNEEGMLEPSMKSKIFEMIDLGNWESGDEDNRMHIAKADRQNIILSQGGQVPVFPYDDHILHIHRHNRHRLSVDYEDMIAQNPMIEQVFQEHVDQHLQYLLPPPQPEMGEPGMGEPDMGGGMEGVPQ